MELVDVLSIIRRYLGVIVLLAMVGGGTGWSFAALRPPQYRATTTLVINPAAPSPLIPFLSSGTSDGRTSSEWLAQSYGEYLKSSQFNQRVAEQLHLRIPADVLATHVTAALVPGTNFWTITALWSDPEGAATLANGVAAVFIAEHAQKSAESTVSNDSTRTQLQQSLAYYQQAVSALRLQRDRVLHDSQLDPTSKQTQLEEIERRLIPLEQVYTQLLLEKPLNSPVPVEQPTAVVLDPATATRASTQESIARDVLLCVFAALLLGFGLVYLLAQLDHRLWSAADVGRHVGRAPLGIITTIGQGRWRHHRGLHPTQLVFTGHDLPHRDAFRRLGAHLGFVLAPKPVPGLMVTSARPGEGKTVVAANLAIFLAKEGKRVILVDANLHRPGLHAIFRIPNETGIVDLLKNPALPVGSIAQRSLVFPSLSIVTSGTTPANPSDLLSTPATAELVAKLGCVADVVVYDLPDVETTSDAAIFAASCASALLVIQAGATQREDVASALAQLARGQVNVVGTVLNRATTSSWRRTTAEPPRMNGLVVQAANGVSNKVDDALWSMAHYRPVSANSRPRPPHGTESSPA